MDRPLAYAGTRLKVVYARCLNGTYPAQEFFDKLPKRFKTAFAVLFKKMGDTGRIFNKEHFKNIEGTEFYEFKRDRYRIICHFHKGRLLLLTNGCEKKKSKLDRDDIDRAGRIHGEDKIISEACEGTH